jgi:hypothetical protein
MRLLGQRWEYQIGNSLVFVDNAFSWLGWGQERLLVNGEAAGAAGGWFVTRRKFREGWITRIGEGELLATLSARTLGIACTLRLDGDVQEPVGRWQARWSGGRGTWPDVNAWQEAPGEGATIGL